MVSGKGSQPPCAERRLQELSIELTPPPTPFGAYVEAVKTGNLLFLSGMLPAIGHQPKFVGRLGKELDANAERGGPHCALNALSAARQKQARSTKSPASSDYASILQRMETSSINQELPTLPSNYSAIFFGEDKISVRMVLGVASLPLGVPVAVDVILEVEA